MKRILAMILTVCLVLGIAASALAAAKPEFSQQPKSATTSKKGTVSFSVKIKGTVSNITWYFVNPQTGEKITGKNLKKSFKKINVSNPNSKKITLKKVPDEMHGWTVYCHIAGNGYKVDSEPVVLNIYGMDPVTEPVKISAAAPGAAGDGSTGADGQPAVMNLNVDEEEIEVVDKEITVTASAPVLYTIDAMGKLTSDTPQSSIKFVNSGAVAVRSNEAIKNWTVGGYRFEPLEPVNGFNVYNINSDTAVKLGVVRQTAATAAVDDSVLCSVSCNGCAFTYFPKGLVSATEGSVPAGAVITVFTTSSGLGFSVNGTEPINQGKASFSLTISEDTTITMR